MTEGQPSFVMAHPNHVELLPVPFSRLRKLPKRLREQLLLRVPRAVRFPHCTVRANSLLSIELALDIRGGEFVVFRTAPGVYALGVTVTAEQLPDLSEHNHWLLFPTHEIELTGRAELLPAQKTRDSAPSKISEK